MTRFAWLQSRSQLLLALALLAVLAVVATITGIQLSHLYASLVAHCRTSCELATNEFLSHDTFMDRALDIVAQVTPPLLGIFWGAPLVARELESGSYRLAWTQSVTRSRWLMSKLALGGLATAAVTGLLSLTITWWYRAPDKVSTTPYAVFDRRDIALIGYALFAFAAGALLGAVIRRVLPAMAATLAAYVAARVATGLWVRPHLLPPLHKTVSLFGAGPNSSVHLGVGSRNGGALTLFADGAGPHNSWTLSSHLLTSSEGTPSSAQISAFLHQYCPDMGLPPGPTHSGQGIARVVGPDAGRACLEQVSRTFHLAISYQPANRYWTFQWLETGVFTALALLAFVSCYWWVTRRLG
jgi:hypothetical protein